MGLTSVLQRAAGDGAEGLTADAFVGVDGDKRLGGVVLRARVAVAFGVADGFGAVGEDLDSDIGDLHGGFLRFGWMGCCIGQVCWRSYGGGR